MLLLLDGPACSAADSESSEPSASRLQRNRWKVFVFGDAAVVSNGCPVIQAFSLPPRKALVVAFMDKVALGQQLIRFVVITAELFKDFAPGDKLTLDPRQARMMNQWE